MDNILEEQQEIWRRVEKAARKTCKKSGIPRLPGKRWSESLAFHAKQTDDVLVAFFNIVRRS